MNKRLYKHLKTGNIYELLAHAIDCTNAKEHSGDKAMVIYSPENKPNTIFTRTEAEFNKKFTPYNPES
jgi:hypothetical protein